MSSTTICIMITIFVYLVGMLLIGFHYAKKNESSSDFYLGGRKLGPLVTAMSAEASDMSSYLLMGLPGLAYLSGLADVGWTAIGLAVGTYLNWLFTAKRLRRYTHITGSFTLPQFFSRRYRDEKSILSAIAAIIIIIFFIPYTASGFAACGKLFHALFGANYMTTMIISAIVIVAYTAAGGFLAASMTDFIQSIIMTVALLFVLIFATVSAGGVDAVMENAKALPGYLSLTSTYVADSGSSQSYNLLHIITTVSWGLGYFGMPHILLRFMAINDEKNLKLSRRVASIWVTIAMGIAVCIGIVGKELSNTGAIAQLSGNNTETIIVKVADLLSKHGILPALMAGLVLSGILASTMSTADSQLLAASSSVSENLLRDDAASEHLQRKRACWPPGSPWSSSPFWASLSPGIRTAPCSASSPLLGPASALALVRWSSAPCSGSARRSPARLLAWSQAAQWSLSGNTWSSPWAVCSGYTSFCPRSWSDCWSSSSSASAPRPRRRT